MWHRDGESQGIPENGVHMGGCGSGRWRGHQKARIVEECQIINLRHLRLEGHLQHVAHADSASLRICSGAERQVVELRVWRPRFGGTGWRIICPCCHRMCMKLYRPSTCLGHLFRCRRCWGLSYRSCQEAHRWDRGSMRTTLAAVCIELGIPFEVGLGHMAGRWSALPCGISPAVSSWPSVPLPGRLDPASDQSGSSSA